MRNRWYPWLISIVVFLVWEALARSGVIPTLFFPAPTRILSALVELARSGELADHLRISLLRVTLGFLIGGGAGLAVGWLTGWFPALRHAVDPLMAALHPLPKVALLPLMLVVFGLGERANVVVVATAAFFPMMISTMSGVRDLPDIYFEVAQGFGATHGTVFRRIIVPGSLPSVLTGVRLAANVALLVSISVELVSTDAGLGNRIWFAWQTFRIEDLWAYLVVISLLGIVLMASVRLLDRLVVPWKHLGARAGPTTTGKAARSRFNVKKSEARDVV
ncbi:MAG: ABC transporter permease [Thermoanaerobaculia bacterium]